MDSLELTISCKKAKTRESQDVSMSWRAMRSRDQATKKGITVSNLQMSHQVLKLLKSAERPQRK
jgi:hypothetical protein